MATGLLLNFYLQIRQIGGEGWMRTPGTSCEAHKGRGVAAGKHQVGWRARRSDTATDPRVHVTSVRHSGERPKSALPQTVDRFW